MGGSLPKIEGGSRADTKARDAAADLRKFLKKEKESQYTEAGKMAQEEHKMRAYNEAMAEIWAEEARQVAEAEALRLRLERERLAEEHRIRSNGMVRLIYEHYNEEFEIVDGCTTQDNVDEVYCLSFVMPGCIVHLALLSPQEMRAKEAGGASAYDFYRAESPPGTYCHMYKHTNYYVYVVQDEEQLQKDLEEMQRVAAAMECGKQTSGGDNAGLARESCN